MSATILSQQIRYCETVSGFRASGFVLDFGLKQMPLPAVMMPKLLFNQGYEDTLLGSIFL